MDRIVDADARQDALARLEALREQHRDLDSRIAGLAGRPYLTPEDQVELAGLKKLKLKKKDEIFVLADQLGINV
ncbi:MAG TPA: DUF465 domain-containing protein [Myxococcota bacterium]|jgi:hypothetical protein|nr:DUF465 domain-containing protein [Myxococcota bacterium]